MPLPEPPEARYLREVLVLVEDQWQVVASDEITVVVPGWTTVEEFAADYWVLIAAILLLVVLVLVSITSTYATSHQLNEYDDPTPVRKILVEGGDRMGASIVRLGLFVWRGADIESYGETGVSKAHVSLAWLVAGPLAARFYAPPARADAVDDTQPPNKLSELARRAWGTLRGARTLVVGRRLAYTSFETADGRENQIRLVSRIDHDGSY